MPTSLADLQGQMAALRVEPLASIPSLKDYLSWRPQAAHVLLSRLVIRHTKAAVEASGALQLPAKTEEVVRVHLRQEEWEIYHRAHEVARAAFDNLAAYGTHHCVQHTVRGMALLTPMRRLCAGGSFAAEHMGARAPLAAGAFPVATDEVRSTCNTACQCCSAGSFPPRFGCG